MQILQCLTEQKAPSQGIWELNYETMRSFILINENTFALADLSAFAKPETAHSGFTQYVQICL